MRFAGDFADCFKRRQPIPGIAARPVAPPREAVERAEAEWAGGDRTRLGCEPPFCPPPPAPGDPGGGDRSQQWNYWTMSLRGGTLSYQTFSAGLLRRNEVAWVRPADDPGALRTVLRQQADDAGSLAERGRVVADFAGFPETQAQDDGHGGKIGRLEDGFSFAGDRPLDWKHISDLSAHDRF